MVLGYFRWLVVILKIMLYNFLEAIPFGEMATMSVKKSYVKEFFIFRWLSRKLGHRI